MGTHFQHGLIGLLPSTVTATSYTFTWEDQGRWKIFNNGSAIAATIPPNSAVPFPIGAVLTLQQYGAGAVTVTAGTGVTLNGSVVTNGQYAVAQAFQSAANVWEVFGNLT